MAKVRSLDQIVEEWQGLISAVRDTREFSNNNQNVAFGAEEEEAEFIWRQEIEVRISF